MHGMMMAFVTAKMMYVLYEVSIDSVNVEHPENSPVSDVVERYRGDQHDYEVEQPVGSSRERVCWSSNLERHNFYLVKPGHSLPPNGEERDEDEDEERAGNLAWPRVHVDHDAQDDHGEAHSGSTKHHERAASPEAVNSYDGDEGCEEELGTRTRCNQTGYPTGVAVLLREHQGKVLCH